MLCSARQQVTYPHLLHHPLFAEFFPLAVKSALLCCSRDHRPHCCIFTTICLDDEHTAEDAARSGGVGLENSTLNLKSKRSLVGFHAAAGQCGHEQTTFASFSLVATSSCDCQFPATLADCVILAVWPLRELRDSVDQRRPWHPNVPIQ